MSAAHKDDQVLDLGSEKYSGYHSAILLASASIVAFAGAAAAEISFSGAAELGYNDEVNTAAGSDDNDGFYSDLNLDVAFSADLDNGISVSVAADIDEIDGGYSAAATTLTISSETATLVYGDTQFAAKSMWVAAGDMEKDGFSDQDGETVLKGTFSFGGVDMAVSGVAADADGDLATDDLAQLSFGAKAALGAATVVVAYQEETTAADYAAGTAGTANADYNAGEVFGISVATSVAGADVTVAYAETTAAGASDNSTGIRVAYPMGDVTVTAYYVDESNGDANTGLAFAYSAGAASVTLDLQDDQGTSKTALDGSYDLGNGLTVYAGVYVEENTDDEYYVAAGYDLGGGASLLVSYADAGAAGNADDEVGAGDYQLGTTVELSFAF